MKKYQYKDYDHYVKCQREGFERKKNRCWAIKENIKAITEFITENIENKKVEYGLCHGTRAGFEQKWFMKYLTPEASVIGTEIGNSTAENTIQRDFNKIHADLIGKFDFVYSNSFDHSFDPEKTINIWANQVRTGGLLIIEWDERQEHKGSVSKSINKTDPVSLTFEEIKNLLPKWCEKIKLLTILDMPIKTFSYRKAIIFRVS
jgi:SAM-dependent methyltransferase